MPDEKKRTPMVPAETKMAEFTFRAVFLGVLMAVMMGAANAYLGLKAGMTIAATYTTAVVGMAVLKAHEGDAARGERRANGRLDRREHRRPARSSRCRRSSSPRSGIRSSRSSTTSSSTIMLVVAGILGIMFVTILRRVLVEDTELPFPESIAAAEIHKSGQSGVQNSRFLFMGMGVGALFSALVEFKFIAAGWQKSRHRSPKAC